MISAEEFNQLKKQLLMDLKKNPGVKIWYEQDKIFLPHNTIEHQRLGNRQFEEILALVKSDSVQKDSSLKKLELTDGKALLEKYMTPAFINDFPDLIRFLETRPKLVQELFGAEDSYWERAMAICLGGLEDFILKNSDKFEQVVWGIKRLIKHVYYRGSWIITNFLPKLDRFFEMHPDMWEKIILGIERIIAVHSSAETAEFLAQLNCQHLENDSNPQELWSLFVIVCERIPAQQKWYISFQFSNFFDCVIYWIRTFHVKKEDLIEMFMGNIPFTIAFLKGLDRAIREIGIRNLGLASFDKLVEYWDLARAYWDLLEGSEYAAKLIEENLDQLSPRQILINRLRFIKTGSKLIPLGGKLTGYMFRIISKHAYETWLEAEEALKETMPDGTMISHCEEIVKKRLADGRLVPRAYFKKDGRVNVISKYAGDSLRNYHPKDESEEMEIESQSEWITKQLRENNLIHGHIHRGNLLISHENGRLVVKLIDFDQAISPSRFRQVLDILPQH